MIFRFLFAHPSIILRSSYIVPVLKVGRIEKAERAGKAGKIEKAGRQM